MEVYMIRIGASFTEKEVKALERCRQAMKYPGQGDLVHSAVLAFIIDRGFPPGEDFRESEENGGNNP
jgi:hypothetical protein